MAIGTLCGDVGWFTRDAAVVQWNDDAVGGLDVDEGLIGLLIGFA